MKIFFGSDVFLGGDLTFESPRKLLGYSSFYNADCRIINLEQAISNSNLISDKSTLYTDENAIKWLIDNNITAVNLANNHIHDKGLDGVIETIQHLNKNGISFFGAGKNLAEARKPFYVTEKLCVLGYCDFSKPYMKQIEVADVDKPGVNPLRLKSILEDLDSLGSDHKAILYFHWGREHVWFPPIEDIVLAKKLLEHQKVKCIIGMHAHRAQGIVTHCNKKAYMCLGNLVFPNFFIKPPAQIYYSNSLPLKYDVTYRYHPVFNLTYKKWNVSSRISQIVEYDSTLDKFKHIYLKQKPNRAMSHELNGGLLIWVRMRETFLNTFYKAPKYLYKFLELTNAKIFYTHWKFCIRLFWVRQLGVKTVMRKIINKYSFLNAK